jgi:hypothetical protein
LRRRLCSADRFNDAAICAGEALKTLSFKSSASLFSVTSADHLFPELFFFAAMTMPQY